MGDRTPKYFALEAARRELGLGSAEFALGIEHGLIRTSRSRDERRIRADEVARWRKSLGELAEQTRLVGAAEAAGLAGVSERRFGQLARLGIVRPVRSYTNRYHVEVWLYSAMETRQIPQHHPELVGPRLPGALLAELASGIDRRAEAFRARRRAQALLTLPDAWTRAAAWSHWSGTEQPPPGRKPITADELVHLARRTAEADLARALDPQARPGADVPGTDVPGADTVSPEERTAIARGFADALRKARRGRPAPALVPPAEAAARLGCAPEKLPQEYRVHGVPQDLLEQSLAEGHPFVPPPSRLGTQRTRQAAQRRRQERQAAREAAETARQERERREREAATRARARVPSRSVAPNVTLHLGPTNSGKTHDALAFLAARAEAGKTGVYVAPLRMLAYEVYERLCIRLGTDRVGLRTGEEQRGPTAPVLCCTAEAAPIAGDVLVVDEAHWLLDDGRGHSWTRLLLSGAHDDVHIAAAPETEALLRKMFAPDAAVSVVRHARAGALTRADAFLAATLPQGSAVVAFSRKAVLALHRELVEMNRSTTVLYGAMPPATRREQIRRLAEGEVDVIVTTDVIGHGVNLPLRAVAFAETNKYDGRSRRELLLWEAAQIAGRAGRRGHDAGEGLVAVYRSRLPGLTASPRLVDRAVAAANGSASTGLRAQAAPLRPAWTDLGRPQPGEIPHALTGWTAAARTAAEEHPWLRPMPVDGLRAKLYAARQAAGVPAAVDAPWPQDGQMVWQLITLPVDVGRPTHPAICRAVLRGTSLRSLLRPCTAIATMDLAMAEEYAATMRDLRTAALAFDGVCGSVTSEEAAAGEEAASTRIIRLVASSRPLSAHGVCAECARPCAPWFMYCGACYGSPFDQYW
ncbi:DUF6397 family protein [Streptomyces sp. NPDC000941]